MNFKHVYPILLTIYLLSFAEAIAQNTAINATGASADASAGLDIDFTNKGILIPRMTTIQRDGITSQANSLLIYNTTTECFEAYHSTSNSWVSISCLGCQLPESFSALAATNIGATALDANWSASSGATTYYLDVDDNNDFSSPLAGYDNLNVGNVTTYTVTGLTCGTTYYIRLRAENTCGTTANSNVVSAANVLGATEVVDAVSGTGRTWMDRNLGASRAATSITDAQGIGDLYQWGRATDGHQCRTSGTTSTLSTSDTPGHSNFILDGGASPFNWRTPENDNLWQGVSGTNNPCPSGYRIPTEAEWVAEIASWSTNDQTGAINAPLKLPSGGVRNRTSGTISAVGVGFYWTDDAVAGGNVRHSAIQSGSTIGNDQEASGMSVRCIKN